MYIVYKNENKFKPYAQTVEVHFSSRNIHKPCHTPTTVHVLMWLILCVKLYKRNINMQRGLQGEGKFKSKGGCSVA